MAKLYNQPFWIWRLYITLDWDYLKRKDVWLDETNNFCVEHFSIGGYLGDALEREKLGKIFIFFILVRRYSRGLVQIFASNIIMFLLSPKAHGRFCAARLLDLEVAYVLGLWWFKSEICLFHEVNNFLCRALVNLRLSWGWNHASKNLVSTQTPLNLS